MNQHIRFGATAAGMTVCLLAGAALTGAASGWNQEQDSDGEDVRIGTFDGQTAFEAYHRTQDYMRDMQDIQQRAMEAQQNQDQQALQQIQMEVQQREQELMQHFERDLEAASPEVAGNNDVPVIVAEIVYKADAVEEIDVTSDLVDQLNADAETSNDDAEEEEQGQDN